MRLAVQAERSVSTWSLWLAALVSWFLALAFLLHRLPNRLFAEDFIPSFWSPWYALRSGGSPYPDASAPLADGSPFLYPPLAAELTLPFSWLPFDAAFAVFAASFIAASALTLVALDVRRPEAWAFWMLSPAVVGAAVVGNVTPVVVLCVALTWRWRDRAGRAAVALTAALVLKLFVWPVLLWLVFTRRYRAAANTAIASAVLVLASWAVIGFDDMLNYPTILRRTGEELGPNGLLAYALAVEDAGTSAALGISLAMAVALLLAAYARREDDAASLTLALIACLYATPIIWLHYFGLLVVPAALYGGWMWATIPALLLIRVAPVGAPRPTWMVAWFVALTLVVALRAFTDTRRDACEEREGDSRSTRRKPSAASI